MPLTARSITTSGLRFNLVVDCANGSATTVAPAVFERLGARVEWMGVTPDGRNINLNCGSLHLESLRQRVLETGADLGIAFDGDADRALFVSGSGQIVDGDAVLFLAGTALRRAGKLPGNVVVSTVMSNLGLEKALEVYERIGASLESRLALRTILVRAGFLYDYRLAQRYGLDTVEMLERWMLLPQLRKVQRYLGPFAVVLIMFVLNL